MTQNCASERTEIFLPVGSCGHRAEHKLGTWNDHMCHHQWVEAAGKWYCQCATGMRKQCRSLQKNYLQSLMLDLLLTCSGNMGRSFRCFMMNVPCGGSFTVLGRERDK